jgi:hypothetical protein
MTDFFVQNEGGIFLLCHLTDAAWSWIDQNISEDHTMFGDAVVMEHRYVANIITGIHADGLVVE